MIETRSICSCWKTTGSTPAVPPSSKRSTPDVRCVTVRHPGRLDVADVLKGDVVAAPGVMVGWTSQSVQELDGTFHVTVDWSAYVVAENYVDLVAKRRVAREAVAQAIGLHLLTILQDATRTCVWALRHVSPAPFSTAFSVQAIFSSSPTKVHVCSA